MKNDLIVESTIVVIIIALVLALCDVFKVWMPDAVFMMVLVLLIVAFGVFAIFIWRESARDEREQLHRGTAGRIGFLIGSAVLTIGIVVQSSRHALDLWLVYALVAMVLSKLLARMYSRLRH